MLNVIDNPLCLPLGVLYQPGGKGPGGLDSSGRTTARGFCNGAVDEILDAPLGGLIASAEVYQGEGGVYHCRLHRWAHANDGSGRTGSPPWTQDPWWGSRVWLTYRTLGAAQACMADYARVIARDVEAYGPKACPGAKVAT